MKNLKIKYKIAIVSLLTTLILGLLFTTLDLFSHYKTGTEIYKRSGMSIVRNIEYQVAHFTIINDVVELQRIVDKIIQLNPDIRYVFILDRKKNVVVHTFKNGFPTDLLKVNPESFQNISLIDANGESIYDFSCPVNEGVLGTIRIGVRRNKLIAQLKKELTMHVLLLVGFIIIGILLSLFISNMISRPINKLVGLTKQVSKGNFETVVEIHSKDEIGILADSFSNMCKNLKDLTSELKLKIEQLNEKNAEYEMLYEEHSSQNEELSVNIEEIQYINKELMAAKEKAEESDRLKTAFLANISHEIRTPMNGIMGFASMLKSPDLSSAQQQKYIDIIEKSGKRMLNIIHNLIDISMIESNQADLYLEPEHLNTILDDLYTFFKPQTDSKGIQLILKKELPNEKSTIDIDKNKLVQVISNLINNAIKFTPSGRIVFGYEVQRTIIKFYVHDTGIGIPENMKEIIFKRFQQADYSYSKGFDGSGLGLSISKAFVEMHGGKIWVDSTIGEGSSFYFTIPHKSSSIKQLFNTDENEDIREVNFPKGLTILVTEDDLTSYLYLEEILKEYSFKILLAQTGIEAIDIVKKNTDIDLILMDIKMPEMNGLDACRIIKAIYPKIPVIIQSAYTQPQDKQKAIQAGCDEYLTKPLVKKTLMDIIAKYVSTVQNQ